MDKKKFLKVSLECFDEQKRILAGMLEKLDSLDEYNLYLSGDPELIFNLRKALRSARNIVVELDETNEEAIEFAEKTLEEEKGSLVKT